jgi:NAD(P)-dependent dehydrogenase (short-subunit alcohol dehydrogenase family)
MLLAGACVGAGLALWRRVQREINAFEGASVVITGGARGLGLELARRFAEEGARLTLVARDHIELHHAAQELSEAGADVLVHACDVRDPDRVKEAVRNIYEARGQIDVLVNNAGIIQVGPMEHMDQADFEEAMDVHVWGPFYLMREVVPEMRAQGGGRIVNISSIGGLVAVPHLLPYVVSKFALTGLSDGMRSELAKDDIVVTTVCPGLMRTGSHVRAFFKGQHEKEFTWFALSGASPLFATDAGRAARKIVDACRRGTARLILTPQARLLHGLNAVAPGLTGTMLKLAGRLLPGTDDAGGAGRQPGWASRTTAAPSFFTRLADRASVRNNELHGEAAVAYPTQD